MVLRLIDDKFKPFSLLSIVGNLYENCNSIHFCNFVSHLLWRSGLTLHGDPIPGVPGDNNLDRILITGVFSSVFIEKVC